MRLGLPGGQPCVRRSLTHSTWPPSQAGSRAVAPSSSLIRSAGTGWQASRPCAVCLGSGLGAGLGLGQELP